MIRFGQEQRAICMGDALSLLAVGRLRGAVWGAAPDTPAMGIAPWNPKMMHTQDKVRRG